MRHLCFVCLGFGEFEYEGETYPCGCHIPQAENNQPTTVSAPTIINSDAIGCASASNFSLAMTSPCEGAEYGTA